jgi:hypothetical protein
MISRGPPGLAPSSEVGMASVAEFLQLLDQNVDRAFRDYVFNVDSASLSKFRPANSRRR